MYCTKCGKELGGFSQETGFEVTLEGREVYVCNECYDSLKKSYKAKDSCEDCFYFDGDKSCKKFARAPLERDTKTSEYLKSKNAAILRNSYLAYLAVHDIQKLSGKNNEQIEELLPSLDSEKEYAHFQSGKQSSSLFKGKKLGELFPKYANVECFFTGMFVENLLWHGKTSEEKEPYSFEVEIC